MSKSNVTVHYCFSENGKAVEEILMESFRAYLRRILALEHCEMVFYPR